MAPKIPKPVFERGMQYLLAEDIIGLQKYVQENITFVDSKALCNAIQNYIDAGDAERAIHLWGELAESYDPTKKVVYGLVRILFVALRILGYAGGIAYLLDRLIHL